MSEMDPETPRESGQEIRHDRIDLGESFQKSAEVVYYDDPGSFDQPSMMALDYKPDDD